MINFIFNKKPSFFSSFLNISQQNGTAQLLKSYKVLLVVMD
jgi:hypothetical protein